jgi:Protein of unknown function (DUF559)
VLGPAEGLTAKLMGLRPGDSLTIVGLNPFELNRMLAGQISARRMLRLEFRNASTAPLAIERILNDLAELAAAAWPNWDDWEQPQANPNLLRDWHLAATRLASESRPPRFPRLAHEIEFIHLLSVFPELVLLAEIDPARRDRAVPIIEALTWAQRHGAAVVILFDELPPYETPWDSFLYGAITTETPEIEPATRRMIPTDAAQSGVRGSLIERRLRAALRAAPDLSDLFEDEVTLTLGTLGPTPRVDLLWRDGKVVVELDGPEHERDQNYAADRHRDYELLVAGYLVLRLTNAEVELDLGRSLEKVRRVVNLRRTEP